MRVRAWIVSCLGALFWIWQGQNAVLEPINFENVDQIQQLSAFENVQGLRFVGWAPNGDSFVMTTVNDVWRYQVDDLMAQPTLVYESSEPISQIAFSADSARLAIASGRQLDSTPKIVDNRLRLIDLSNGQIISEAMLEHPVSALAFSPDRRRLVVVYGDTFDFSIWSAESLALVESYTTEQPGWPFMLSAVFNDESTLLALGSGGGFNRTTIWDTETGEMMGEGEYGYSDHLVFSRDSSILAGTSRYGGYGKLWYWQGDNQSPSLEFVSHHVLSADFNHNGTIYAQIIAPITMSHQYTIQFINPSTGEEVHRMLVESRPDLNTGGISMSFSPDDMRLLIYEPASGISLWGITTR